MKLYRYRKTAIALSLFLILGTMFPSVTLLQAQKAEGLLNVQDETVTSTDIYENTKKKGLVFEFTYPKDEISIVLEKPDGTYLKPGTSSIDVSWEELPQGARVEIKKAPKGMYVLHYPNNYTNRIGVVVKNIEQEPYITDFEAVLEADGTVSYSFMTDTESAYWFNYNISLKSSSTELFLASSEGYTNREIKGTCALPLIPDGDYYLQLEMDGQNDAGGEVYQAQSNPISYESQLTVLPVEQYQVTAFPEEGRILVDWSEDENAKYDGVFVQLKQGDTVVYQQKIAAKDGRTCQAYLSFDQDVTVSLKNYLGNTMSVSSTRLIASAQSKLISLPESSYTSSNEYTFHYQNVPQQTSLLVESGTEQKKLEISGEGTVSVSVNGTPFHAVISFEKDGVIWKYERELYIDKEPPYLELKESYNDCETDENYLLLEGEVEEGAAVSINGEEIAVNQGQFKIPLVLQMGDNAYKIEAVDEAGNITEVEGVIHRLDTLVYLSHKQENPVLRLIATYPWAVLVVGAGVVVILLFVLALIFIRRWKAVTSRIHQKRQNPEIEPEELKWLSQARRSKHMGMISNMFLLFGVISMFLTLIAAVISGYSGQITGVSQDSNILPALIVSAYHVSMTLSEMKLLTKILCGVTVGCYLVCIVLKIVVSWYEHQLEKLPSERRYKEQQRQERRKKRKEKSTPDVAGVKEEKSTPEVAGVKEEKSTPDVASVREEKSTPEVAGVKEEKSTPDVAGVKEEKSTPEVAGVKEEKSTPDVASTKEEMTTLEDSCTKEDASSVDVVEDLPDLENEQNDDTVQHKQIENKSDSENDDVEMVEEKE